MSCRSISVGVLNATSNILPLETILLLELGAKYVRHVLVEIDLLLEPLRHLVLADRGHRQDDDLGMGRLVRDRVEEVVDHFASAERGEQELKLHRRFIVSVRDVKPMQAAGHVHSGRQGQGRVRRAPQRSFVALKPTSPILALKRNNDFQHTAVTACVDHHSVAQREASTSPCCPRGASAERRSS